MLLYSIDISMKSRHSIYRDKNSLIEAFIDPPCYSVIDQESKPAYTNIYIGQHIVYGFFIYFNSI